MNKKLSFLALGFLLLLIIGCNRRTPAPITQAPAMQQALEEALPEEKNTGAPELRYVMPNSWRNLTRLDSDEEARFLQENSALLNRVVREALVLAESSLLGANNDIIGTTRVYREVIGNDVFYRLITINSETQDFSNQWEIQFLQALLFYFLGRLEILAIGSYNSMFAARYDLFISRRSIDIIRCGDRAKGVLATIVHSPVNISARTFTRLVNGQPWGINRSKFVLMQDFAEAFERNAESVWPLEEGIFWYEGLPSISIDASDSLIDPDIPLRYSLQNAFDGNPKTAFIANPETGLMSISFTGTGSSVIRIAIINGYTYDFISYKNNNRIKTISIFINGAFHGVELTDNTLSWQFSEIDGFGNFSVRDIIRGNKFNRTVISGYNVYSTEHGWLFGVISE